MKIGVAASDDQLVGIVQAEAESAGHEAFRAAGLAAAVALKPHLVFVQLRSHAELADLIAGLHAASAGPEPVPVVVVAPEAEATLMQRARAEGAVDVLFFPPDPQEIRAEIDEIDANSGRLDLVERAVFEEITRDLVVGQSPVFRRCLEEARLAARSDANVLLLGETGTGKEMLAQAIHRLSRRRTSRFVAMNCAAVPKTLLESELFGYTKGAFTGADMDHSGRFGAVGAGTLLLDEIADIKPGLQIKLLRAIDQRKFEPLGDCRPLDFHGRLISATFVDLEEAVAAGRFRQDLLGRIDQFRIVLPPLRERRADIALLAQHFLRKHAKGRPVEISRTALEILENHDLPMNVRQLENALVAALARSDRTDVILPRHLPKMIVPAEGKKAAPPHHEIRLPADLSYEDAREEALRKVDSIYLPALSNEYGSDVQAAKAAGIDRKTFVIRLRGVRKKPEGASDEQSL